jgi:uncharacterized protein
MPYKETLVASRDYALWALVTLLLVACAPSRSILAQNANQPLWTRDSIRSSILGEMRFLRVSTPAFYNEPNNAAERFPVLIVLDAEAELPFTATAAAARQLGVGGGAPVMPQMIIVGVETPNPARFRDMTPPPVRPFVGLLPGWPAPGGAPAFLRFLSEELRPYLAARYRTQPVTILAGHSLTGSFAAWAFGQAPDFLAGAIVLSPTPGWLTDDALAGRQVLDGIAARTKPGRLFLATGSAERYVDTATQSFAAALRARNVAGLVFEDQRIPGVAHANTGGPLGMIPGLQFIFRAVSLSGFQLEYEDGEDRLSKFSAIFDSTRQAFLRGAHQLGLRERLPLNFLSVQARGLADTALAPLQLRLCQEIATSYPTLWNGYDCAGDALARMGRASEAAASYRRGSEAARGVGDSATAERLTRKAQPGRDTPDALHDDRAALGVKSDAIRKRRLTASLMPASAPAR